MTLILSTPEKMILRLEANESLFNAIRRNVSEIPTLAIDEVEIFKNDSALYDEMISHRLGLVPLKTEKGMSSKTKIEYKLSRTGPGTVYSGDLKGAADVVYDNIPITILGEGNKIELVATAVLGKGINHSKHIPGLCYYRHLLEVKSSPEIDELVKDSKGLIKPEKKGNKWVCDIADAVVQAIESIDNKAITETKEVIFVVESYGPMPAKDILSKSIEALTENLDEFEKAIK